MAATPDLTVTKTHTGNFRQGNQADLYTITVNNVGLGASTGLVTATDVVPAGLSAKSASGTGWTTNIVGSVVTATRADILAIGTSYPPLLILVRIAGNAPSSMINRAHVSGGGELNLTNDSSADSTSIIATADFAISKAHVCSFKQGDSADIYTLVKAEVVKK